MESFFTRFKNVLVLVAILLAQTIGLAVQVRRPVESGAPDSSRVTLIRYWAVSIVTPLTSAILANKIATSRIKSLASGWSKPRSLKTPCRAIACRLCWTSNSTTSQTLSLPR
jgi:hypothetical protein